MYAQPLNASDGDTVRVGAGALAAGEAVRGKQRKVEIEAERRHMFPPG